MIWRHDPWPDLVMIGFDQLSHYSSGDLQVMLHLSAALELIEQVVPEYRRETIRDQGRLLVERGRAGLRNGTDSVRPGDCLGRWCDGMSGVVPGRPRGPIVLRAALDPKPWGGRALAFQFDSASGHPDRRSASHRGAGHRSRRHLRGTDAR
ncbi:MAG: hypothetical protein R2843_10020 [Thermomicrobiales bacterium]